MKKLIDAMAAAYQEVSNPQSIEESHFKVGDKVEYEAADGGEYDGKIVKLDEPQTGAYYHVKLDNGKVVKAKPEQLEKEDDDEDEDEKDDMKEAKMDPVGQADADIDNDGDVDKTDKYLHNRRKAIKKSMKKGKDDPKGENGETATMNPKMDSSKSEQKEEVEVDEALKPYDKNADFRVVNRLKPKQRTGSLSPSEKKQLANAQARLRNHGVSESFRDKLLSVLENREKHYKGAMDAEAHDDNWSPGAKKMQDDLGPMEVEVDGSKAAAETAKNIANSVKASPKNPTDKSAPGDNNIVNQVVDAMKGLKK